MAKHSRKMSLPSNSKILLASVDCLPRIGGISQVMHHLANAIVANGKDVIVFGPKGAEIPSGFKADYQLIASKSGPFECREGKVWSQVHQPALMTEFECILEKENIEHALLIHPFTFGPPLVTVCNNRHIPISVMFHGFELKSQLVNKAKWHSLKASLLNHQPTVRTQTLDMLLNVDEVLTNSHYTASLMDSVPCKAPVNVIGCGIDLNIYKTKKAFADGDAFLSREKVRNELGFVTTDIVVGSLGRLVESKNIEMLLKALIHLPKNYKALILGDGPQKEHLVNLASSWNLCDRIVWRSNIKEEDKWAFLHAMDIFTLLSRELGAGQIEGFGLVLLEATTMGRPVIVTRSGGMVDVVSHEENGLMIGNKDVEALVTSIKRLVSSPQRTAKYIAAARLQIETKYNWNQIARTMVSNWQQFK